MRGQVRLLWLMIQVLLLSGKLLCNEMPEGEEDSSSEHNETSSSSFYTAAVVELHAPGDEMSDVEEIVEANLEEYLKIIEEAGGKGVDILVFPEGSLNYNGISSYENLTEVAVDLQVEAPIVSECDLSHDVILSELSFAAANASIYVLVNVVEMEVCSEIDTTCPSGFKLYNTNLVFDRNGCVISRYRKFNLFKEDFMNVTSTPDIATFNTDFGVTFGHFVCFDILFKSPALDLIRMNVKHILYPSMWFSELPFLTSIQIQQAFAQANNIVLISAGTNSPSNANTGSGIFVGQYGAVDKIISWRNETRMIIAEIPKNLDDPEYEPSAPSVKPYSAIQMDSLNLWKFTPNHSHPLKHHFKFANDDYFCDISLNYTRLEVAPGQVGFGYRLVAFSGTRSYAGIIDAGEVHCAIVSCVDENDETTCGQKFDDSTTLVPSVEFHFIHIELNVKDKIHKDVLIMPTSLDTSILPLAARKYIFDDQVKSGSHEYSMKSTEDLNDVITFGIYGRQYNLDHKTQDGDDRKNSSPAESASERNENASENPSTHVKDEENDIDIELKMTVYVVLMVALSVITAIMVYRKLKTPYIKPDLGKRKSVANYID